MKYALVILCLLFSIAASAQHYHKCTTYTYEGNDSSNKHLYQKQYFTDFGRITREDDYNKLDYSGSKYDTLPFSWTKYFYEKDTILWMSIKYEIRYDKRSVIDSTVTRFHYNTSGLLYKDTAFKRGLITFNYYDVTYEFLGRDTLSSEYLYDQQGRKIEELTRYIATDGKSPRGYKNRQTWSYTDGDKTITSYSYRADISKDSLDPQPILSSKSVNTYLDNNLINERFYYYSPNRRFCDSNESVYTSNYYRGKIVIEKMDHYCFNDGIKRLITSNNVEYGYFPDKRKIKETYDYNISEIPVEITIYIYE